MVKRGRKREPTAMKLAKGTYRPDRHGNPEMEPQPAALSETPGPPEYLGEAGQAAWRRNAAALHANGLLTAADLDALAGYCEAFDEQARCREVVKEAGEYLTSPAGTVYQHPAINRRMKAEEQMHRYRVLFGMTPASRSGVQCSHQGSTRLVTRARQRTGHGEQMNRQAPPLAK